MRRRVGRLLLAAFVALYGAAALCGPALHSIPGLDHTQGAKPPDRDGADQPISPHDDCPVCLFLAQGQLAGSSPHVLLVDVVRVQAADDVPLCFPPAIDRPSRPRGPPAA